MKLLKTHTQDNIKTSVDIRFVLASLVLHAAYFINISSIKKPSPPIEVRFEEIEHKKVDNSAKSKDIGKSNRVIKRPNYPVYDNSRLFKLSDDINSIKNNAKDDVNGIKTPFEDEKVQYATFFDRVRERLDYAWQDKAKAKVTAYLNVHGTNMSDKRTKVIVTLDSNGRLVGVHLVLASSDSAIDAIALEAFRESAIFPNPPKDLIKDNKIVFDWDFIIDLN